MSAEKLIRVYTTDNPLLRQLGLHNTFRTLSIGPETSYEMLVEQMRRKLSKGMQEESKKAIDEQMCHYQIFISSTAMKDPLPLVDQKNLHVVIPSFLADPLVKLLFLPVGRPHIQTAKAPLNRHMESISSTDTVSRSRPASERPAGSSSLASSGGWSAAAPSASASGAAGPVTMEKEEKDRVRDVLFRHLKNRTPFNKSSDDGPDGGASAAQSSLAAGKKSSGKKSKTAAPPSASAVLQVSSQQETDEKFRLVADICTLLHRQVYRLQTDNQRLRQALEQVAPGVLSKLDAESSNCTISNSSSSSSSSASSGGNDPLASMLHKLRFLTDEPVDPDAQAKRLQEEKEQFLAADEETKMQLVQSALANEFEATESAQTLFRGSSKATVLTSLLLKTEGADYVRDTVEPLIRSLDCESLEVDPRKVDDPGCIATNVVHLVANCERVLDVIYEAPVPPAFTQVFRFCQQEVVHRFPQMQQQVIGGLFFLRFVCPELVTPSKTCAVSAVGRRNLILVSKVLQNLANNIEFGDKELYMQPLNPLIVAHRDRMTAFLNKISRPNFERKAKLQRTLSRNVRSLISPPRQRSPSKTDSSPIIVDGDPDTAAASAAAAPSAARRAPPVPPVPRPAAPTSSVANSIGAMQRIRPVIGTVSAQSLPSGLPPRPTFTASDNGSSPAAPARPARPRPLGEMNQISRSSFASPY